MKFQGLKNDCFDHALWIYDRIFNNDKPVDIAFLGSSHTINGINDKLIEQELDTFKVHVVNFGYCRLGRNFTYALLKEIIREKQPKYVILEVLGDEDRYSHPIFPYISRTPDVMLPNPFFNRDLLADMFIHLSYKIELTQDALYKKTTAAPLRTADFGFASSKDTAASELLEKYRQIRSTPKPELKKMERNFHMSYPRRYLKKTGRFCRKNNIRICFLYLPSYGSHPEKPKEYTTYLKYGQVIIPPEKLWTRSSNWYDENHLNQSGARELSLFIAGELGKKLKN